MVKTVVVMVVAQTLAKQETGPREVALSVISANMRLRQDDRELEASLGYIATCPRLALLPATRVSRAHSCYVSLDLLSLCWVRESLKEELWLRLYAKARSVCSAETASVLGPPFHRMATLK